MSEPANLVPGYFRVFQGTDGSFVDIHETHGKLESRQNLPIALFLAAWGERVRLLSVLDLRGVKSPDAARDGVEWEFKVPEGRTANAIDKALRGASRQAARVLTQVAEELDRHLPGAGHSRSGAAGRKHRGGCHFAGRRAAPLYP